MEGYVSHKASTIKQSEPGFRRSTKHVHVLQCVINGASLKILSRARILACPVSSSSSPTVTNALEARAALGMTRKSLVQSSSRTLSAFSASEDADRPKLGSEQVGRHRVGGLRIYSDENAVDRRGGEWQWQRRGEGVEEMRVAHKSHDYLWEINLIELCDPSLTRKMLNKCCLIKSRKTNYVSSRMAASLTLIRFGKAIKVLINWLRLPYPLSCSYNHTPLQFIVSCFLARPFQLPRLSWLGRCRPGCTCSWPR